MARKQLILRSRKSFTRLARFFNQLMREQLMCGPVTVQQCYTLEALVDGPRTMNELAAEVALHQSTLTRVVEKLEKQNLVQRRRLAHNQRSVEVQITEAGKKTHEFLDEASSRMISDLLDYIPRERQVPIVEAMEEVAQLFNPGNEAFQKLLKGSRCNINSDDSPNLFTTRKK
ncbi:MAG: MarR family transcriptional regulator [bacterium]|nr:MarR family transcriptional regulator [bacterium]